MKNLNIIIFDLDSTLVRIEGLDWLAERKEKDNQVKQLTKQSMEGLIGVQEAMIKKMDLISPTYEDFLCLGQKYSESVVKGAKETIATLHKLGKEVWIVTGNFQPAVGILASELGIPANKIVCNKIFFYR